jgi:hypothetical protein
MLRLQQTPVMAPSPSDQGNPGDVIALPTSVQAQQNQQNQLTQQARDLTERQRKTSEDQLTETTRHDRAMEALGLQNANIKANPPPKTGKLSSTQQADVRVYRSMLDEIHGLHNLIDETGIAQSNDPLTPRFRTAIATKAKMATDDPRMDKIIQNVSFLKARGLRMAAGNQRMTQYLAQMFEPHVADPNMTGKRLSEVLDEMERQTARDYVNTLDLAGVGQTETDKGLLSGGGTPSAKTAGQKTGDLVVYQGKQHRVTGVRPDGQLELDPNPVP